jgi:two-component system sensor histidine kinase/response regulator
MPTNRNHKILIVEDNQESLDLLVYFLKPQGYEIITAHDGLEALQKTKQDHPDLILLDILLPGMDGFRVCESLKKDNNTMFIPIIMITALKELKDKIKSLEAGADDFITKPFENVDLLARVKSLLRLKDYHTELEKKNNELEEKNQSLMRMDQFKEKLINLIIHDMKNPLFVIQGNVQMMSLGLEKASLEYLKKYTQRIERSSQHLLKMIVNLLDISRMQEGAIALKIEPGDFNNLVNEIVSRIKEYPENEKKEFVTDLAKDIELLAFDSSVMERILESIINFSANNTDETGKIIIKTKKAAENRILFTILDDGVRIPEKFHEKIFQRFSQIEIKDDGYRISRGLALIYCKMAIEAHKGRMWLDTNNTKGNLFCIELPYMLDI